MRPLTKKLPLQIFFLLAVSIQTIRAQDSCFDCNYDSLANQLKMKQTDAEKIKLLTLLIDLTGEPAQEPRNKPSNSSISLLNLINR